LLLSLLSFIGLISRFKQSLRKEKEEIETQKEKEQKQAALLKKQYESATRERLSKVRSKKELWEFVKPATRESLSQYYSHTKSLSLNEAIEKELSRLFGTPKYATFLERTFPNTALDQ
jgi:hypothetical protein